MQPVNEAWNGADEQVSVSFSVDGEATYSWEKLVDGEWVKVEGAEAAELTVTADTENLKYAYRCVAALENGEVIVSEEITLVREDIAQWLNETEATEDMLARAMAAKSVDSMVVEGDEVVYVRTGKVYARIDRVTGYLIDEETGLVVARVDLENGMIYPIGSEKAKAE